MVNTTLNLGSLVYVIMCIAIAVNISEVTRAMHLW